jgi:SAM-dependent methyltransferase
MTEKHIDPERLCDWWSNQAQENPTTAGVLGFHASEPYKMMYRQWKEWTRFLKLARLTKSMRVLELGCGGGRWSTAIARRVRAVTAVDFSPEMVAIAEKRARKAGLDNVTCAVGKAQEFQASEPFNLIYLSGVDQYIEDPDMRILSDHLRSMLVPGGVIIDRVTLSLGDRLFSEGGGYQSIYRTAGELNAFFEAQGFHCDIQMPSHNPRARLPYRFENNRFLVSSIERLFGCCPSMAGSLVDLSVCALNRLRPESFPPLPTTHDFLRFVDGPHPE